MADNNNDFEDYKQEAYHDVKKSRFQAFKDFFNRQKALPESTESKHKKTNIDMKTSMSLTSIRAGIVERVGNFFEAISKIGSSKKDENLNKFAKEVVGTQDEKDKQNAVEKSLDDTSNEAIQSQQPRYFPGNVAIKNTKQASPSLETVIIAETASNEIDNKVDYDSIDEGTIEIDTDFVQEATHQDSQKLEATTMNVAKQQKLDVQINNKQPQSGKTPQSKEHEEPEL